MTWSLSIVYHLWARISNFIFKLSYGFARVKKRLQDYEKNAGALISHWLPTLILSSFRSSQETKLWLIATSVLGVLRGRREWGSFPFHDSREVSLSSLHVRICRCPCMLLWTCPYAHSLCTCPYTHTPCTCPCEHACMHTSLGISPYAQFPVNMPLCTCLCEHVPVYRPLCTRLSEHVSVNMPLCTCLSKHVPMHVSQ